MHRPYSLAIGFALLISLILPAATTFAAASISLSSTSGAIGSTITVSGSGFAANATVHVLFGGSGGIDVGSKAADGSSNLSGLSVVVPNVTGGSKEVFATDGTNTTSTTFLVPFSLTLNPTSGGPGTTINVSGTGFLAEPVSIAWDQANNQLTTATANANGAFSGSFTAPNGTGTHQVIATGQNSHFVLSTAFALSGSSSVGGATLTVNPSSGAAGSVVNLSGTGFSGNEQVNVTVDGNGLTSFTSDGNGNFTTSVTPPSSLGVGSHTIGVTGASSGHSATAVFQVTNGRRGEAQSCTSSSNTRPGHGFGDDNHCHTGPHGGERNGHGHGNQGDNDDQGEDS